MSQAYEDPRLSLVIGGAASGKSEFAETLFDHRTDEKIYLATSQNFDAEMDVKIQCHRNMRGPGWTTHEEPLEVSAYIRKAAEGQAILLECATMWISNLMMHDRDIAAEFDAFVDALDQTKALVVIVSSEVGQGIVPNTKLSRAFRDHQGQFNQIIARKAERAYLVCAGLPVTLKSEYLCTSH